MKREKKVRRRRRSSKKIQSRIQSSFSASFLPNWIFSAQICFNWLYQWRPEERDKLFSLSTSYPEFWQQASCLPSSLSCQSERHSNNELIIQEREKWCHTSFERQGMTCQVSFTSIMFPKVAVNFFPRSMISRGRKWSRGRRDTIFIPDIFGTCIFLFFFIWFY